MPFMGRICQMGLRITSHAVWRKVGLTGWQVLQKLKFCGVGGGVIGMRVSPGIVFPAHISLGMRVSPHIYH